MPMQIHTQELLNRFPVRKNKNQKAAFRDWLTGVLTDAGYTPVVESGRLLVQNHNVVVGDPEQASVVFTAHYDTPARLLLPNINFPKNYLFTLLAQLPLLVLVFLPTFVVSFLAGFIGSEPIFALLAGYAVLLLALYLLLAGPANPTNVNDNTSGVATLLEIALTLPAEYREQVAFVFFDNEELGLLGSAKFKNTHKKALNKTPVINFDCVSDGDFIAFVPTKKARKDKALTSLVETSYHPAESKSVQILKGHYPSDQQNFPLGLGVAALRKSPFGLYLGRIHTARDTVFEEENIELLRAGSLELAKALSDRPLSAR